MAKNYVEMDGEKITRARLGLNGLGLAGGLIYAYATKKGFWGYVGFAILGGMIGNGIGYVISKPKDENGKDKNKNKNT